MQKTKVLATILTLCMIFTLLPGSAFAASTGTITVVGGVEINYSIDDKGAVTIKPTAGQLEKLLETISASGEVSVTVPDIEGMTAAIVELDLAKLTASDKLTVFKLSALGTGISLPADALASMQKQTATLRFGLAPGSMIFELNDAGGKTVNWNDYKNPITVSISRALPMDISTHQIVMTRAEGSVVPRSWYSDGMVRARINLSGTYGTAVKSLGGFADTAGLWMNEAVGYMAAREIVNGVSENRFDTQGVITRAHFVTMLMRALDLELDYEEAMPPEDFADAPEWAKKSIRMAPALGIDLIDENGNFSPNAPITRQDMFYMAYQAMDACGMVPMVFTLEWIIFPDWEGNVKGEYTNAIQNLCKMGLVSGNDDGTLNPNGSSTRAEGAQFLYNILKYDAK